MAGNKNSGRKSPLPKEGFALPSLEVETVESLKAAMRKVRDGLATGEIEPRRADSISIAVRTSLALIAHEEKRDEDVNLERMLKEAQEVVLKGQARIVADRQHVTNAEKQEVGSAGADPAVAPVIRPVH